MHNVYNRGELAYTDSMGPGRLIRHMQSPSYTCDTYLICIGLGPSISSVIAKSPAYSGPLYALEVSLWKWIVST